MNTADQKRHIQKLPKYLKGILIIMTMTRDENENERWFIMKSTLIKDTTKEERIALIREWLPDDDGMETDGGMDLWDLYADYINGTKEIAECNAAFSTSYMTERDLAEGKLKN